MVVALVIVLCAGFLVTGFDLVFSDLLLLWFGLGMCLRFEGVYADWHDGWWILVLCLGFLFVHLHCVVGCGV